MFHVERPTTKDQLEDHRANQFEVGFALDTRTAALSRNDAPGRWLADMAKPMNPGRFFENALSHSKSYLLACRFRADFPFENGERRGEMVGLPASSQQAIAGRGQNQEILADLRLLFPMTAAAVSFGDSGIF